MSGTGANAVTAARLTKRYGDVVAVDGIDFAIAKRECFGFLGVNGAGKTTTMKMVYCRTARSAGALDVLGWDAATNAPLIKQRIGVVTQDNALDPELTVLENLLLYASFFRMRRAEAALKAARLLALLGLEGKDKAQLKELSGGMKRRLVIARALLNDPELLVLDEPTTGLDPQGRLLVWEKLLALRDGGITLVLTTHYMEEAARLCDRLAVMHEGRIYAQGPPDELIDRFAAKDVLEVVGSSLSLPQDQSVRNLVRRRESHGETEYLYNADNGALLQALERFGAAPQRHIARAATLEDVFLNITGRELRE